MLTVKTPERHLFPLKYSKNLRFSDFREMDGVVLVSLLLTLNILHNLF